MTLTPPNSYAIGATVTLTFTFLNSAGAVFDPGDGNFYVREPDGTIDTTPLASATRVSTGIYTINVVPDAYGFWYYRAVGTSPNSASLDQYFNVESTQLV